jgi:hypothetical protein
MEYYTYAYLREDKTPYYIGKGKNNRIYAKSRNDVRPPKDKSKIIFLKMNLNEEEAFKHEIYMINIFGRKDLGTGILHNKTNGGDGASGVIISEETKIKISNSLKGRITSEETKKKISQANKGKIRSEETKNKISESMKGEKHHMYGKKHSEKTIKKMKELSVGKYSGENNPMWGKKRILSQETIEKIRKTKTGKTHTEETKNKISKLKKGISVGKGMKWWTDGQIEKRSLECPGDNLINSRIKYKKSNKNENQMEC